MRGKTLAQLLAMLRTQSGMSSNTNLGINMLDTLKDAIRVEQERLYHAHDWPFLMGHHDVWMQAGQRYYDWPVDPESVTKIEVWWGGRWHNITKNEGIDGVEYSGSDSDNDIRQDPVQRWGFYMDAEGDDSQVDNLQFEAWPMPATSDEVCLRFWGKRAYIPLIAEATKAMLDDWLIVLYASVGFLKSESDKKLRLAKANDHFSNLKKRGRKRKVFVLGGQGGDCDTPPCKPGPVRVAYTLESTP